jgi:hypothetical protein
MLKQMLQGPSLSDRPEAMRTTKTETGGSESVRLIEANGGLST